MRLGLVILLGAWSAGFSFAALPPILPVSELTPGMRGKTLTVMQGTEIVELETEILGVWKNALAPGKDLIVARLVDEKTKLTGAVHGMSGSPLYIDGKLVGALSRRLGMFEKDGHCGFTPIEDMLDVGKRMAADDDLKPFPWSAGQDGTLTPQVKPAGDYLALPLSISGWNERLRELLEPLFPADGLFVPLAGGGAAAGAVEGAPIAPGSPLAVVLMSGDIDVAGTGTVTAVDDDEVLAFGHPMLGVGAVEFPFARAEIISTLPSYYYPHKISNTGQLAGTLKQDRLSAVAGNLGKLPALAAYEIQRKHNGERRPTWRGQMVKDYRLAPMLVLILAAVALDGGQDYSYHATLRLKGEIVFEGLPPVKLDGIYSGRRYQALFDIVEP
ncbi:MAG: sporulation protein SpoOM, partial [Verrucomicrobiales bacterium]|nr:sporulation protein SpoOM [Verrucomicrobiales bacterium]